MSLKGILIYSARAAAFAAAACAVYALICLLCRKKLRLKVFLGTAYIYNTVGQRSNVYSFSCLTIQQPDFLRICPGKQVTVCLTAMYKEVHYSQFI